jgi:hypothetical protein
MGPLDTAKLHKHRVIPPAVFVYMQARKKGPCPKRIGPNPRYEQRFSSDALAVSSHGIGSFVTVLHQVCCNVAPCMCARKM